MKFFDFESAFDEAAPTSPAPKTSTSSSSTTAKSTPASKPAPAAKPASTPGSKSSFNFNQFTSLLRKGGELAKVGTQVAGQFSGGAGSAPTAAAAVSPVAEPTPTVAPGAVDAQPSPAPPADVYPAPASPPVASPVPGQSAPGVDQITQLLQALQQQQAQAGPAPADPAGAAPPPAAASQPDGMTLLRAILANPQFQQALTRSARQPGAPAPRSIALPVQASGHPARTRQMQIPMGAVLNAIATLAGHSMAELNASTAEDEPEVPAYLVGEDGEFLVDPTCADARAALVTRWFLASNAAQHGRRGAHSMNVGHQPDPSDAFAREAGFPM